MSFERFFSLIDTTWIGNYIEKKREIIENTDPQRIYIENIRAFFNMPFSLAKFFCELAVKEKVFNKKIGILCPNENCERIIQSCDIDEQINETIVCIQCELMEKVEYRFKADELERITFYQLQV
jgi:hypothetical protein